MAEKENERVPQCPRQRLIELAEEQVELDSARVELLFARPDGLEKLQSSRSRLAL